MARKRPATTHGMCVVDKPPGVTSHDVVGMLRRRFGERQVGHAGTLDPDATGVLVVGVGMATKLLRYVEKTTKHYVGEVVLGSETSTLDSSGDVLATFDMSTVTVEQALRNALVRALRAYGELTGNNKRVAQVTADDLRTALDAAVRYRDM